MEHNSSFNKQLRKEITARAVMNIKIQMLKADIDENNKKMCDIDKKINKIQKTIRRRKQKHKQHREPSSRLNILKKSKTDLKINKEALYQKTSNIEEVNHEIELKIKQLKKKIKNLPIENPFDFTDYLNK